MDEIEQGLNKSLAAMLIGLFTSPRTNPHGAQLVFTTHYAQLLDSLRRNDGVYLLTRTDDYKTRIIKYSEAFARDDYRKSDVTMSSAIRGANPPSTRMSSGSARAWRSYVMAWKSRLPRGGGLQGAEGSRQTNQLCLGRIVFGGEATR